MQYMQFTSPMTTSRGDVVAYSVYKNVGWMLELSGTTVRLLVEGMDDFRDMTMVTFHQHSEALACFNESRQMYPSEIIERYPSATVHSSGCVERNRSW